MSILGIPYPFLRCFFNLSERRLDKLTKMKKENAYQAKLIKKLRGYDFVIEVLKNNAGYVQGFPDLTIILTNGTWALLECKREENAKRRPNQGYYVGTASKVGFSRFIFPENEEEVLRELCEYASRTCR